MRGPVRKRTIEHAKGVRRPGSGGRVSGHALLDAWHADQNEVDVIAVEEIAQVLQGNGIEAFRFVENDQLHVFPRQGARRLAGVLIDANIDAAESFIDLVPQRPEIGANIGRRKEDARPRERRIYLLVCFIARSPASEKRSTALPMSVPSGGLRLSHPCGTAAESDVAFFAHHIGKLCEPAVLFGDDESLSTTWRFGCSHSSFSR